jgi:hypothetical protein
MNQKLSDKENILLVSYYFPPVNTAGIYRILAFSKYLPENGIRPILLTSSGNTRRENIDSTLTEKIPEHLIIKRIRDWCLQIPEGDWVVIKILRKAISVMDRIIPIDPFLLFGFAGSVTARILINKFRCRAIVTSSPPHSVHWIGYFMKRFMRIPWIADFRDPVRPWIVYRSIFDRYLILKPFIMRYYENMVVKEANYIIANTPTNKNDLIYKYPWAINKFIVIQNGFDAKEVKCLNTFYKEPKNDKLTISYIGEIYEGMGDILWESIRLLRVEDPSITEKLEIVIAGIIADGEMQKIVGNNLLDIVKFLGFLEYSKSQEIMANSNIALVLLPPGNFSYWIPSKIYNYFSLRKFVLGVIPEGDASTLIEEVNAGTWVPPEPERVASAIKRLIQDYRNGELHADYREDKLMKYTRAYQSRQLADVIKAAIHSQNL